MKRWLSAGLLLISIVFLLFLSAGSLHRTEFSAWITDSAEYTRIKETGKPTAENLIHEISFNDCPLFYDERTAGWFYSVSRDIPDTDPQIAFTAAAKDIRIAFSAKIIPGQTVPFLAYNGSVWREYSLTATPLPLIRIECDAENFLPPLQDIDYPVRFTMIDNRPDVLQPVIHSAGRFHIRGHGSAIYEKKAFRLSLYRSAGSKEEHEDPLPLLGLRPDGDWLLYPGYNDQEKIRNVFSSNLWLRSCGDDNNFGIQNGNEYRFAELFLNRQYWGLYAIGSPIDAKQMHIVPNIMGHYEEFIFKQSTWGPGEELTTADNSGLVPLFDADAAEVDYGFSILKQYFEYINAGAPDGLAHNDAGNAVDIWLFLKLIQADDSIGTARKSVNNIIYTIKSSDEGKKILYTPWDMDRSWGNTVALEQHNTTAPYALRPDNNRYELRFSPVSVMLRQNSGFAAEIRNRYAQLRAESWSDENITSMIDSFEADIFGSGAYAREMERWPDGSYIDPEAGLSLFRAYVLERFRSMDEYIAGL